MATRRMGNNLCLGLTPRLRPALQFAAAHSIYPQQISFLELTTAQALLLSLFHSLLHGDTATAVSLLSIAPQLPQLGSSFISIWLRDDYRFSQEDVAKVLSTLAKLVNEGVALVPLPIITALCSLEEKYDLFSFFCKSGDTTAQEMLACLNPLVTRATQAGPESLKDQAVEARPVVESVSTQTDTEAHCRGKNEPNAEPVPSTSKSSHRGNRQVTARPKESTSRRRQAQGQDRQPGGSRQIQSNSRAQPVTNNTVGTAQSVIEEYLDAERMEEMINVPDIEGNLPIHRAALDGRTDVVEALLLLGAGLNDLNFFQMTPLQMAISSSQTETIVFLLSHGASLESRDFLGMTPLHHAAHHGAPEVMRLLLSYRVNKEAKDVIGNRPLHIASKLGHTEVVRMLVAAGANKKVKDSEGFRPLDWALHHGNIEMMRLLQSHGQRFS